MKCRDGLAVADLTARDLLPHFIGAEHRHLDPLVGLEAGLAGLEVAGHEDLHPFVGEAGGGEELAQPLEATAPVSGLLGQLAPRGRLRSLAAADAAGAELQQPTLEGDAVVANQHQTPICEHRHHRHRPVVPHDHLFEGPAFAADPCDPFDVEGAVSMQGGDLPRLGHCRDDRSMPLSDVTSPADAVISTRGLTKSFGRLEVLRGIDLDFFPGQTTVVLGPSGTGKSVLLKLLVGLLRPDAGSVSFRSTRLDRLSESALSPIRRRIGYLFQQGALFDSLSVFDNVAFPMREAGMTDDLEIGRRVGASLRLVGLGDLVDRMPSQLSGGQQKRAALARAIVLKPEVVLYDEPTTGLDPIRADLINELILRLQRTLGVTSIVVTHDLASAFKVADRMVMLHEGKVVLDAPPSAFRDSDHPVVGRFLRGEASAEDLASLAIDEHSATSLAPDEKN